MFITIVLGLNKPKKEVIKRTYVLIKLNRDEFKFTFSRSSGAGGQNVNKVNTRVTLTWDMAASSSIKQAVKERFMKKYARFIVGDMVVIHSQKYRVQSKNIDDCVAKLQGYLENVEKPPKKRVPTKPTKSSVKKRLDKKSKDSEKKRLRREKF